MNNKLKQIIMKTVILKNTWLFRLSLDFGWGNGYVIIPINHKLHGTHHDDVNVDVHGGLTFSGLVDEETIDFLGLEKEDLGSWCLGFDTSHYGDTLVKWSKERVQKETEYLRQQLINY